MLSLNRLVHRLRDIDIARQYSKGIYLQEELSALSRLMLCVGVPGEAAATFVLLAFTAAGNASLPPDAFATTLPLLVGLGFLPLFVLVPYFVRAATVAQRTAATLPFTTPEQELWPSSPLSERE